MFPDEADDDSSETKNKALLRKDMDDDTEEPLISAERGESDGVQGVQGVQGVHGVHEVQGVQGGDDEESTVEFLRQEAASMTGVDVRNLPSAKLLNGIVKWIFSLLVDLDDGDGTVPASRIVMTCQHYDDRLSESGIMDTLDVVGVSEKVTERSLYHWLVFMFGECSEDEFVGGINDFGEAARTLGGGKWYRY